MSLPSVPISLCADGAGTPVIAGMKERGRGYREDAPSAVNTISYGSNYWSSSPNANNSNNAWNVNFNNGNSNNNNRNNNNAVRLVRGGEWLMEAVTFEEIYNAWWRCRRRKGKAPQAQLYEARLLDNLLESVQALQSCRWSPRPPVCFMVNKPKAREIYAAHFSDRVIHHWLVPQLEQLYEPLFIHDLYSNRQGKGTHSAVIRLQHFMRSQQQRTGGHGGYYLQIDIHNFFNSIDRPVLFRMLQKRLAKAVKQKRLTGEKATFLRDVIHRLLRQEVAAEAHTLATPAEMARVPPHKRLENAPSGKGLPIGNLTSQFFANVYLNELDQFIKHHLKCRHYLRYVDDAVLLSPDPAQLHHWQCEIEQFLAQKLILRLKPGSTCRLLSSGVDFLGYITRPHYRLVRRRVVGNLRERLISFQQRFLRHQAEGRVMLVIDPEGREQLRSVLASYLGHFKHARHWRLVSLLFKEFSWLHGLFGSLDSHRLIPLWEPRSVAGYRSQQRFFSQLFPNASLQIQCGYRYELYPARKMPPAKAPEADEGVAWRAQVIQIKVTEQGYLKGGLKRRVIHRMVIHPINNFDKQRKSEHE